MKNVLKTNFHSKLSNAFMLYDKINTNNDVSIVANGPGFQKIIGHNIYVVSELQALSCENNQGAVDKIPLVYLPKKHLKQKVKMEDYKFSTFVLTDSHLLKSSKTSFSITTTFFSFPLPHISSPHPLFLDCYEK